MSGRGFGVAYAVTVAGVAGAWWLGGVESAAVVAMLAVLEVALSFDNAVVNATVLRRFNDYWQKVFLSVGILVAVLGMRLLIPTLVLVAATRRDPVAVVRSSFDDPAGYRQQILKVQPLIAAFGGVFLLMIFLGFLLDGDRERTWLTWIENRTARLARFGSRTLTLAQVAVVAGFLAVAASTFGRDHRLGVPFAGVIGLVSYLAVRYLSAAAEGRSQVLASDRGQAAPTGRRALMLFCYLELLDASFSFDSVMGGFSVTVNIALFAIGLGIGTAYVRCLTVYLVRRKALDRYVYLEHGAYYSIGVLAVLLLVEIGRDIPDWFASLAGTAMIAAAFLHSVAVRRRRDHRV
ncbi:DUF475 domain-containing protein [Catenulispora rubra]|uniref:DUF475 domain-containing protein n=1 Tax=Catenulispora rubra TaxID=280293 RepID=UPI0018924B64|nr:DUF475 domain-containing protein [Catenulispora rubra]